MSYENALKQRKKEVENLSFRLRNTKNKLGKKLIKEKIKDLKKAVKNYEEVI